MPLHTITIFFFCTQVLKKLDAAAAAQETLDLQDLFFRFTIDTFCFIAFGIDLHSLEKDHPFAKAFDQTQQVCRVGCWVF